MRTTTPADNLLKRFTSLINQMEFIFQKQGKL